MPRVEGAAELDRILKAMPKDMAVRQMQTALRAGGEPIASAARNFAPVGSREGSRRRYTTKRGREVLTLRDSIGLQTKKTFEHGITMLKVGPDRLNFYAPMVEYGHAIVTRGRKKGSRAERLATFRGQSSSSGRVPAYPFMRPAWEMTHDIAFNRSAAKITETVHKWGRKNFR